MTPPEPRSVETRARALWQTLLSKAPDGDDMHYITAVGDEEGAALDYNEEAIVSLIARALTEARAEGMERAARMIPTNWCDPLLTGDKAALSGYAGRWGCPDIESLLEALRRAIRAAATEGGGRDF